MRRSTLLLGLLAAGCGAQEQPTYAVIDGFLERTVPARCTRAMLNDSVAITEIRSVTDSTWLLLDEAQRRVTELDHELRPLWSMALPAIGPGAVIKAVSAGLLGDTAVAIVDRGTLRLQVLSRGGEVIRSTPLGFLPNALATTASGQVLVTPLRMGDDPPTLLVRFDGEERTDVPVPPRYYRNGMHRAMGNIARVETFPDGRAVLSHEYLAPRGFLIDASGGVEAALVPTPDATLDQLDYLPSIPATEEDQERIMVPTLAIGIDRSRSEVYLMTRSGRTVDGSLQRAILRLDDRLGLLEAFTADVPAFGMAVLPRHGRAILADEEDRLFTCDLPLARDARAP